MTTTEPAFYDRAMTDDHEPAMLPLDQSPWLEVYRLASWMISPTAPVIDLGCGTGRFAEQLRRRGHGEYVGLDFSPAAIQECLGYVPLSDGVTDWSAYFEVCDLRDWLPGDDRSPRTVYTCLETLEHLEDDLDLIRRIPTGHELIFSVPNFGGEAHLRVFQDPRAAYDRYSGLLAFRSWTMIGDGPLNHIHLYRALRRGDSW